MTHQLYDSQISVSVRFHWNIALLICFCDTYGCFFVKTAEFSNYDRIYGHKALNTYHQAVCRECLCVSNREQSAAGWFCPAVSRGGCVQTGVGGSVLQVPTLPVREAPSRPQFYVLLFIAGFPLCLSLAQTKALCCLGPLELTLHYSKERQILTYLLQVFSWQEALESMRHRGAWVA